MKRLRRKSFRGKVSIAYPSVRKMFRVEKPWSGYLDSEISLRQKNGYSGAGYHRHWARESLSRRFVQGETLVDPNQDLAGQAGLAIRSDPVISNGQEIIRPKFRTKLDELVGNPKFKKKFIKICRGILGDLGLTLVGPLPMRALEIMWQYFGEEHFSAHGRACWCRLCRSIGPARVSFLQSLGDSLYDFFIGWKFAVNAIFGLIAPAPLKMARFVANKLWKWLKIVLS